MTSPAETTSRPADESIEYPVICSGTSVDEASGAEMADCYYAKSGGNTVARRIAAAMNATQHIPTEQLEQVDHKTKRLLPVEVGRAIPIKSEGVTFVDLDHERAIEAEKAKDEDRLRSVNAELLAALRGLLAHAEYYGTRTETPMPAIAAARAAIAKAEDVPATPEQIAAEIAMEPLSYVSVKTSSNTKEPPRG